MTEGSISDQLLRRVAALPAGVRPTRIQLTREDLMRLRSDRDALAGVWRPGDERTPETWHGVPLEIIPEGGPHIHYASKDGTPGEQRL